MRRTRRQHPAQQRRERHQQRQHQADEPAEQLAPEAPQLLLVGTQAHRHAEGERAALRGVVLELDGAALDRHAVVAEGRVRRARARRAAAASRSRPPGPRWRASATGARGERICAYSPECGVARRGSRVSAGGRVAAVGLRVGGGDQRHHLRIEQLAAASAPRARESRCRAPASSRRRTARAARRP